MVDNTADAPVQRCVFRQTGVIEQETVGRGLVLVTCFQFVARYRVAEVRANGLVVTKHHLTIAFGLVVGKESFAGTGQRRRSDFHFVDQRKMTVATGQPDDALPATLLSRAGNDVFALHRLEGFIEDMEHVSPRIVNLEMEVVRHLCFFILGLSYFFFLLS